MAENLVLTNFRLFVGESGSNKLLRLNGLLIALSGLTVQLVAQPFHKRTDDAIASVVRLMLVLSFILGTIVKLCDIEDPNAVHSLLDAQIGASTYLLRHARWRVRRQSRRVADLLRRPARCAGAARHAGAARQTSRPLARVLASRTAAGPTTDSRHSPAALA